MTCEFMIAAFHTKLIHFRNIINDSFQSHEHFYVIDTIIALQLHSRQVLFIGLKKILELLLLSGLINEKSKRCYRNDGNKQPIYPI